MTSKMWLISVVLLAAVARFEGRIITYLTFLPKEPFEMLDNFYLIFFSLHSFSSAGRR